jgi:hypothetical protein
VFDLYVNGKTDKEIYKIIKDGQDW